MLQGEKGKSKDIFRTLFFLLFAMTMVAFFCFCALDNENSSPADTGIEYIDSWTVTDENGESFETGRAYNDERILKEDFVITSRLPENISDGSLLCFLNRSDLEVFIGGVLRADYIVSRDVNIPGGTLKSYYIMIPLSSSDSGSELRMNRYRTLRHPIIVPETFIISSDGLRTYLAGKYGTSFILSAILFVTAVLVIVASAVLRMWYGQRIDMMYAAFAVLDVSAWLIFVSQLFPFVFGQHYSDGVMGFVCCLMMPFAFLIYLDSIQKKRYSRVYAALHILSLVNLITWSVLHFTGTMSFAVSLPYVDAVLAVVAVTVFVTLILDIKTGYAKEYRYTAIGFIGFMAFCFIEIFMLVFVDLKSNEIPMLAGLMFLLVFVVIQQVDDLRRINVERQRAIELSNAKTRFLASMSHEIRTPINSILGMNEMIIRENRDDTIDGYARSIQSAGRMLLSLVNDVLDFSRIESGRIDIVNAECRVSSILKEITPMLRERAFSKGLAYETVIGDGIPDRIVTDEVRVKQILINLINNGIKYTERGGITLKVSGEYEKDVPREWADAAEQTAAGKTGLQTSVESYILRFDVKDTGQGIRDEDKAELFEAFSRIDIKKNRNVEGTGLGLTIVKNVVVSMNGEISVESEYGKGSVFSVYIPVAVTDRTPVANDYEAADTEIRAGEGVRNDYTAPDARILAVDDNTTNLSIVRLFLKRTGIVPEMCVNGMDALGKCRKEKYDLILLDHMMPEPDGIETLKLIREDEASLNRDTAAVVLTANAVAGSRQLYLDEGFADYLTKPLDPVLLEQTVRRFLPKEKIIPVDEIDDGAAAGAADDIKHEDVTGGAREMTLRDKLSRIEGMDYEAALMNSAGEEDFLIEILGDICDECDQRIEKMRSLLATDDIKNYAVEAHAMKSLMATVGIMPLSEHAKKHELEAKAGNADWIKGDSEGLLIEYRKTCDVISSAISE